MCLDDSDDEEPGSPSAMSMTMSAVSKLAKESVARRASVMPGKVPMSPRRGSPRGSPRGTPVHSGLKLGEIAEESKSP